MAPEQMLGGEIGPAADQFAFAVAFYESLCGQRPFQGRTELETISNTIAGIVRPWDGNEHVPEKLRPVIERMLSGRREDRYPSMTAAREAIRESLGVRRQLRVLTDRWLRHDRKDDHLLPKGELLAAARDLARRRPDSLDDDQKTFIQRSHEAVRRRLLTRRALVGTVGALAVGMVPALYLLRRRTQQLEAETRARVETTLDNVVAQIDALFAESTESLRLMLDQRSVWMPDVQRLRVDGAVGDPELTARLADATRSLNRYFRPVLEHSPTISSLMVSTDSFEYLAFDDVDAHRLVPPYLFYNRMVNTAAFGVAAFQLFDGEQAEWLQPGDEDRRGQRWAGYDPGERIFYRRAARAPAIGWTEPYLFFVSKEVGITGSSRFDHEGVPFVLAVDVTLTDLSQITSGVDAPGVQTVVLTRDDEVVALPRDDELRSRENIISVFARYDAERQGDEAATLPRLADLGYDRLTEAWAKVRGEGTGIHECLVDDAPHCVGVRPVGRQGQELTLLVVAERS